MIRPMGTLRAFPPPQKRRFVNPRPIWRASSKSPLEIIRTTLAAAGQRPLKPEEIREAREHLEAFAHLEAEMQQRLKDLIASGKTIFADLRHEVGRHLYNLQLLIMSIGVIETELRSQGALSETYGKLLRGLQTRIEREVVLVGRSINARRKLHLAFTKGVLNDSSFSIVRLLQETVESLTEKANKKGIAIILEQWSDERLAFGDADTIWMALANVLHNAIIYTKKGGVTIAFENDGDFIRILVRDTGIGIAADAQGGLDYIFERNQRGQNVSADIPGSGTGLWLCREMLTINRGSISVQSEVGKGSTFTIKIRAKHLSDMPPDRSLL